MKFYPELILAVMRSNEPTGGVRLFCVAKHYDNGNGNIPVDEFKAYAKRYLGIGKSRFNRWLRDALRLGIVKRSGNVLALVSWGQAAVRVGVTSPLNNAVEMGVTKIVNDGWAAWVWAAYLKRHENKHVELSVLEKLTGVPEQHYKPITRATLEELTGIPERTQRAYESQAGVENHANYGDFGFPDENPDEAIAEETNGYFWYAGRIKKRLGNSRIVNGVEACKRGRTAQHNRIIWAALSLWDSSQTKNRLYFYGPRKAQALKDAMRKIRKSNQPIIERPNVLFLHVGERLGVNLWAAKPCE